jgi:hypothetical protein
MAIFGAGLFLGALGIGLFLAVYLAMYRDGGTVDAIQGWGLAWLCSIPGAALASIVATRTISWFSRLHGIAGQAAAYVALTFAVLTIRVLLVPLIGAALLRWT